MQATPELVSDELLVKLSDNAVSRAKAGATRILGSPVTLTRLTPNLHWYSLRAKAVNGLPPSGAFELAHQLLAVPEMLAIEPEFRPLAPVTIESQPEFSSGKDGDDPDTTGKFSWHLAQVKAKEARDQFGVTGATIRVAHPDTGYTLHPELITGAAIRADLGYNFKENVASPIEPLSTIDHGHGTATASVLVGIEGKQHNFPNEEAFVEGVAPGAELVPFRVDDNVFWVFSAKKDAKAIDRAVDRGCHVISMSRSGTDKEALRDAIARATAHGVIVVAAAGNCNVGCGIFSPANYQEVVCAAGTTHAMRFWESSSRGPEVTTAAPARSVYRARAFKDKKKYGYSVERSSGTSYATPIVAGSAALWLQRHGGTAALAQKLGGLARVPVVFKHMLKTAGFQKGVDWNPSENGPGILDCMKLLSAPLPPPPDLPNIDQAAQPVSQSVSGGVPEALRALRRAVPARTDGRAARLLALEFETMRFQSQFGTSQPFESKGAALLKHAKKKEVADGVNVSPQLREVLSRLAGS